MKHSVYIYVKSIWSRHCSMPQYLCWYFVWKTYPFLAVGCWNLLLWLWCCLTLSWSPPRFSLYIWVLLCWVYICLQCLCLLDGFFPWVLWSVPQGLFLWLLFWSQFCQISIATPAFFPCLFTWNISFHPFTFNLCRSFVLRWVSCRQHMCGSYFLIHSATLCLWLEHLILLHLRLYLIGIY